jgi:hypothetical protein
MKSHLLFLFCIVAFSAKASHPDFKTVMNNYKSLEKKSKGKISIKNYSETDAGIPLPVVILNPEAGKKEKRKPFTLLINNGIHPGEPDGIDASFNFCSRWLEGKFKFPSHFKIVIIPVYNIDGALNRNCCSRANQNGPEEYGFRGNGRNLDLNRDFIKCDSRNAKAFTKVFHDFRPQLLIDTHVSNGADYRYTMTLLMTQADKLGGTQGKYLRETFTPKLFEGMKKRNQEMVPYVYSRGETPESGVIAFLESPRFATGYAALFGTIGITAETHMLKPYEQRVEATLQLIETIIETAIMEEEHLVREQMNRHIPSPGSIYSCNFRNDTSYREQLAFKGYQHGYKKSEVHSGMRLYYDRTKPVDLLIPYFPKCKPSLELVVPKFYIIPVAWEPVIKRMEWNEIPMKKIKKDTSLQVEVYYIEDVKSNAYPYEGHYLHHSIKLRSEKQMVTLHPGDVLISTQHESWRYIMETLEPLADDSFFHWNFFDAVLNQKEYYSAYVFEDLAADYLKKHPELRKQLEEKIAADADFAKDNHAQLDWVYRHSPWYEKSHKRYPIFRVN